jgi:protein-L-isoaspartate O-methyltransferase
MTDIYAECHAEGGMTAHYRNRDPQRLAFVAARYLFVAKMLEGCEDVLEVGCADGYFSPIVRQHVGGLSAIDSDTKSIAQAQRLDAKHWPVMFAANELRDLNEEALRTFDAAYALDVLEHIPTGAQERAFLGSLAHIGRVVIGMPSAASQVYASELSKQGHTNCKSGPELMDTLSEVWSTVLPFSMNDMALYPGFSPMARYYLAVCIG